MEAALADGAAGGGAAAPAAPATPAAAAPAAPASPVAVPGVGADPGSALGAIPAAGAPAAPGPLDFLQEKFHVKTADGKLDEAASFRKQAEAYAPLVKRLGTDELPPALPTEYKITPPEGTPAEAFNEWLADPETVKDIGEIHKLGLTNSQTQGVIAMHIRAMQQVGIGAKALTVQEVDAQLGKVWTTPAELAANKTAAMRGVTDMAVRLGVPVAELQASGLLVNPYFIREMAKRASELGEDQSPAGAGLPTADLDSLLKSEAYMNPNHPQHLATKQKVQEHYNAQPGATGKARGPVRISL
jgi:hypothetical protein